MIDLHSHLLPGIDDGSKSLEMSLEMAKIAVADGIIVMACTPHIQPGVYDNHPADILEGVKRLEKALADAGIVLRLVGGSDIHVVPDLVSKLKLGEVLPLARGRYFLFEPPHHIAPPGLLQLAKDAIAAGYVPVLTHPERLTWIENQYQLICDLDEAGCAIQLTAGSITGGFGERPKYWAKRMLEEGRVDIIASDAHHPRRRAPVLSEARKEVASWLDEASAANFLIKNPMLILRNHPLPQKSRAPKEPEKKSFFRRWLPGK